MTAPPLSQYPFTPRSVPVTGEYRLSCVDEGRGEAVVMLHGNPSWSYLYRRLIIALRGSCRCIAPDHLGCGLSDKPEDYPYLLEKHIENLELLLDRLGVERCVLVMHDWGGAVGMGWAGRHPQRVRGMVVMNTAAFASPFIPWRIAVCRWPGVGPLLVRGMNLFARSAVHMAVHNRMDPDTAAGFLYPYRSWADRVAILRFVQDIPMTDDHPSWKTLRRVEDGLAALADKPMLICWGGRDFCFTERFYQEWRHRFPRAAAFYFPDAGHYLLEDDFAGVMARIRVFLASLGMRVHG
jgi:haloalkane dehalogenase